MKTTKSQQKEINKLFRKMNSKSDFLALLNYTKTLIYKDETVSFTEKQLNFHINSTNKIQYATFEIRKKSGKHRTIHAPSKGLKEFQKALNIIIQCVYKPHENAFGFTPNKSIVDNASKHVGKNYVYNIDLKDFFPSIDASRVWGRLKVKPFNLGTSENRKQIANMIKAICCSSMDVERFIDPDWEKVKRSVLPQGAPTSPILTNAICERLDIKLTGLAKRFGLQYSRYADDITFSSMHNTYANSEGKSEGIYKKDSAFDKELRRIITNQNFHINEKKVRLQKRGYKQEVTGLIVNEKINTSRKYSKEIRQWLYFLESKSYEKAYELFLTKYMATKNGNLKGKPNMFLVIEGKLLYLKMIKGETNTTYLKLKSRFDKLVKKEEKPLKSDIEKVENVTQAEKKPEIHQDNFDLIIETIFEEGLEKAMNLYRN